MKNKVHHLCHKGEWFYFLSSFCFHCSPHDSLRLPCSNIIRKAVNVKAMFTTINTMLSVNECVTGRILQDVQTWLWLALSSAREERSRLCYICLGSCHMCNHEDSSARGPDSTQPAHQHTKWLCQLSVWHRLTEMACFKNGQIWTDLFDLSFCKGDRAWFDDKFKGYHTCIVAPYWRVSCI